MEISGGRRLTRFWPLYRASEGLKKSWYGYGASLATIWQESYPGGPSVAGNKPKSDVVDNVLCASEMPGVEEHRFE